MDFSVKKINTKVKTEISPSKSLPKLKVTISSTVFQKTKFNELLVSPKKFPEKWTNLELTLKKASLNLDMDKRISIMPEEQISSPKKILPHPIHLRKSLSKFTGLKFQKQKILNDDNVVHITAQKWLVYDCVKGQPLKGFKYKRQHDIASLSKILTFYTAYAIIKEYKLSIDKLDLIVMKEDQIIGGIKIPLQNQNIITLEDCLYAILLNSANNAATVLANNLGYLSLRKRQNKYFSCFDINSSNRVKNISFFISLMQHFAKKLQLTDTYITNPHGMSNNLSNARDIARLFDFCWKIPLFQTIMQTKQRPIKIKYVDDEGNFCQSQLCLKTTNTMEKYNKVCRGGKTGENKSGGNSFVSYFQMPESGKKYIIVVLGSLGRQQKFRDTDRLYQWISSSSK